MNLAEIYVVIFVRTGSGWLTFKVLLRKKGYSEKPAEELPQLSYLWSAK